MVNFIGERERLAALIAPFLLAEIKLEVYLEVFNHGIVEIFKIFTKKFGNSIKGIRIHNSTSLFTLKCFNLPPSLKSFDFIGKN